MSMNRYLAERRRFLKLVGATALTYPFLRGVPSFAAGADTGNPMYLVLLYTSCGVVRPMWGAYGAPATGATAVATPLSSSAVDGGVGGFRPTLTALKTATPIDLTSQVIVLDGLNNAAAEGGPSTSHEAGMASLWTGTPIASDGQHATGQSIDQAINSALLQNGVKTSPSPLALYAPSRTDDPSRDVHNRMLYQLPVNGSSDYVDPISIPSGAATSAMSLLFGAAGQADAGVDPSPLIRQKVQAQVNSELKALMTRVCSDDRIQLQVLQTQWHNAEMQLAASATQSAMCQKPVLGAPPAMGDPLPYNITAMSNILAMALACDLTRVASLQFSQALSIANHTWIDSTQTQPHHAYSHIGPTSYSSLIGGCTSTGCGGTDPLYYIAPGIASPAAEAASLGYPKQLWDIDAWYAKQVAAFAYMLSQLKAPNGNANQSLLDYTVICWGSELDMGNYHNHDDTPFVLIGGAGSGKLKTGQLVRFPLNLSAPYYTPGNKPPTNNRFHNDLLVTLADVMGVGSSIPTFGATSVPGTNFQGQGNTPQGPLTLNQGVIQEILAT
jgi:hypothetical protein